MTRETKTMPSVIYVEKNIHGFFDGFAQKQHLDQYHNTQALREKIEGMRKQIEPHDWATMSKTEWMVCTRQDSTHNAALDAILAMMEE